MKNQLISFGFLLALSGCGTAEAPHSKAAYFDLKGFISAEASKLQQQQPEIQKTVVVNGSAETKSIKISDWNKELSAFSDADLNKAAWRGMFAVRDSADVEVYSADQEKIPVKELRITKHHKKVTAIRLVLRSSNSLYTSTDTLSYYPDSLYDVRKSQKIRLLDQKNYRITGLFRK